MKFSSFTSKPVEAPVVNVNDVTRIPRGAVVKGDLMTSTDVRVDGNLDGALVTVGKVVAGNSARVKGQIICYNLDFSGKAEGELFIKDTLVLKAPAVINGNVHAGKMQIELGAQINGTCKMITDEEFSTAGEKYLKYIDIPAADAE